MLRLLFLFVIIPVISLAQNFGSPSIPAIRTNDYYIEYPVYPVIWQLNQPQTGDTLLTIISPYGTAHDKFLESVTLSARTIDNGREPLTLETYYNHLCDEITTGDPSAVILETKRKKDRNSYPYQYVKYQVQYNGMKLIIEERCYIKKQTVFLLSLCYQYKGDSYHTWMGHELMKSFYLM